MVIEILIKNSRNILNDKINSIILLNTWVNLKVLKTGIKKKIRNIKINSNDPEKPNCSEKIAKTKSVSFSGRKSKLLCDPSRNPFPFNPPDPMAIFDWIIW